MKGATHEFIQRPQIVERLKKEEESAGGAFDVGVNRKEQHIFSGPEQDSFSFDLGNLEDKIYNTDAAHVGYPSNPDVDEEDEEIKQILGSVTAEEPAGPSSCYSRSGNEGQRKLLNY